MEGRRGAKCGDKVIIGTDNHHSVEDQRAQEKTRTRAK